MAPTDSLSVLDTSFLNLEKAGSHMHVGGVTIFEGPPLRYDDLVAHVASRLHLVPRYRQKVLWPALQSGRPRWADDPCFNLEYHVRHTALPRPGSVDQLRQLTGRVFSQRLDRDKPLWEMWLVDGLDAAGGEGDGRFAIINKTHHALIDGMSGVDILSLLFDLTPEPREVPGPDRPWAPRPKPTGVELVAESLRERATAPIGLARRGLGALRHPRQAVGELAEGARGIGDVLVRPLLTPAPEVPLNTSIGPHRRVTWVSTELSDFKAIKNTLGGTVNDVVLAVVAGALRRWLRSRGVRTEGLELRALVPVSVRTKEQQYQFGNRVAAMRGPLPVYVEDPVERLRVVTEAMRDLKESKQALGAEVITELQEFAPPTLLAQAARLNFSTRLFNTIVTNVPGPQVPLYLLGRELEEIVPLGFLAEGHALFFAIMSYNGRLDFGLLGDRDTMDDLDAVAVYLEDSLAELRDAAAAEASVVPAGNGHGRLSARSGGGRRAARGAART